MKGILFRQFNESENKRSRFLTLLQTIQSFKCLHCAKSANHGQSMDTAHESENRIEHKRIERDKMREKIKCE